MMRTRSSRLVILSTVLVLLLASSCSSGSSTLTAPKDPDQPLVLWMYGDSLLWFPNLGQGGALDPYTDMLAEDLGVRVSLRRPPSPYGFATLLVDYLSSDRGQRDLAGVDTVIFESPIVELHTAVVAAAGLLGSNPAG